MIKILIIRCQCLALNFLSSTAELGSFAYLLIYPKSLQILVHAKTDFVLRTYRIIYHMMFLNLS